VHALFLAVFVGALALYLWVDTLAANRHRRVLFLLEDLGRQQFAQVHGERVAALLRRGAGGALRRTLGRLALVVRSGAGGDTARKLVWSGSALTGEQFGALRLLACGVGGVAGVLLGGVLLGTQGALPVGCVGALGGYAAPEAWLAAALARRRAAIDRELLYFLDFLALAAQAGLSVDHAVGQVAREFPGILSVAFMQVQVERGMGQWNEHALAGLAGRLGHRDVQLVVDALTRAGRFGSRTADVLRELAATIRRQRNLAAAEHANRAGTAIILPVAVFIMPAVVLILGYPALTMVTGALGTH